MQSDGSAARTSDLLTRCQRLEKENKELAYKCKLLDSNIIEVALLEKSVVKLENEKIAMNSKINDLDREMRRRETGIDYSTVIISGNNIIVIYVCVAIFVHPVFLLLFLYFLFHPSIMIQCHIEAYLFF